jgi:hypothetical protein
VYFELKVYNEGGFYRLPLFAWLFLFIKNLT